MNAATAQHRLVVEYPDTADATSKVSQWSPPLSNTTDIGGIEYVTVGYSGDRGFARYCGGDTKISNPLKFHNWLAEAIKSRNDAVAIALDKVAVEKLLGHVPGQPIKNKRKLAEFAPEVVKVNFPAVKFEGTEVGPCEFNVKVELDPKRFVCVRVHGPCTRLRPRRDACEQRAITRACPLEARCAIEYTHWCKGRVGRRQRAYENARSERRR